jgi:hypothetical protein
MRYGGSRIYYDNGCGKLYAVQMDIGIGGFIMPCRPVTQWLRRLRASTKTLTYEAPFAVEEHLGARREKMKEVFVDGTFLSR